VRDGFSCAKLRKYEDQMKLWQAVQYFIHAFGVRPLKVGRMWYVPCMGEPIRGAKAIIQAAEEFLAQDAR